MSDKTSSRRVVAAKNRVRALELRSAGAQYKKIAEHLDVSVSQAHRYVTQALADLKTRTAELAEDVRALELLRLDDMLLGLWTQARRGDIYAIDRVLKIMDRRAKFLGLDLPPASAEIREDLEADRSDMGGSDES